MAPPISEYGVVASVRTLIPNAAAPNGPRHPGVLQIFRRAPRQGDGPFGVDRPAEALLRWVPWVRDSDGHPADLSVPLNRITSIHIRQAASEAPTTPDPAASFVPLHELVLLAAGPGPGLPTFQIIGDLRARVDTLRLVYPDYQVGTFEDNIICPASSPLEVDQSTVIVDPVLSSHIFLALLFEFLKEGTPRSPSTCPLTEHDFPALSLPTAPNGSPSRSKRPDFPLMYQGRPSLSQLLDQHQRRLHARNIPASPKALFKKFSDMAAHAKENLDYMDIHYTINSLSERANHRRRDFLAGLHSSHSGAPMPAGPQQPGYIIPPGDLDDQWIVMDETPEMASVAGPGTASVPSSLTAHHQVPFHPDDYPFGFQEAVPDVQPSLLGDLIRQMEGHTQGRPSRLHAQPHRSLKREAIERAIAGGPVTSLEKNHLLRTIYYWGCDEDARRLAWPFLLGLDQWSDTVEARRDTWAARLDEYIRIRERVVQFLRLTPEEQRDADPVASESWCQILKDIERTDRNQTYFRDLSQAGRLGRILLAYILHRPDVGYTQGMNDWLSPLLVISTSSTAGPLAGAVQPEVTPSVPLEYRNLEGPGEGLGTNGDDANIPEDVLLDAETFWLFHAIMEKIKDNFSPDGRSITAQLACLVNILGQVDEPLMEHLTRVDVDWVLFCYRWVLVCLKRELPWADFLRVWESSWTNYDGPNFFLLIAVAYLGTFREEILSQDLDASGVLKAFNDRAVRLTVGTPSPREVQAAERLVPQAQLLRQLIAHRLPELHRTLDRDVLATIGEKTPADPVHPLHTLTATRPDEGAASRGTALVDPPGSEAAEEESQSSPAVDPVVPRPPSPMMGFCD